MKKLITSLAMIALVSNISLAVHAAEILDRDYIESEIWEEMWLGKDDDGTEFPEASYKRHLLDEWLNENYGSDDYDWTAIGELKYQYKDYYNSLTEKWNFNDENGKWTIETEDNTYSFMLTNNAWQMIDQNGNAIDSFPIFSTLEEEEKLNDSPINDNGESGNRVIGSVDNRTETYSDSLYGDESNVTANDTKSAEENDSERSEGNALPLIIGGAAIVGIGTGIVIYKKRK